MRRIRQEQKILPVYKMVIPAVESGLRRLTSTLPMASEMNSSNPARNRSKGPLVLIRPGVEFDYATVHSVKAIQAGWLRRIS